MGEICSLFLGILKPWSHRSLQLPASPKPILVDTRGQKNGRKLNNVTAVTIIAETSQFIDAQGGSQ